MRHDEWLLQLIIPFSEAFNSLGRNDAIQLWVSLVLRQWFHWDEDLTKASQMWLLCAQSDKNALSAVVFVENVKMGEAAPE